MRKADLDDMTMNYKSKKMLQVEEFNSLVNKGDPVTVTNDIGDAFNTVTTSEAFLANCGTPVVFLNGISGYYLLDRVKPIGEELK